MDSNALALPTTLVVNAAALVSNAPSDGKADPIIDKIIGYGTCQFHSLNSQDATVSLLPSSRTAHYESVKRFWKFAGIAAVVLGTVGLVGSSKGVDAWHARTLRIEAEARAEVARKDAVERQEKMAAEAKALTDALVASTQTFGAFVDGAAQASNSFATAKLARENPQAAAGIAEAVKLAVAKGALPDYVKALPAAGPWTAPIVYRELPDGDFLFGVAIDDKGYMDDQPAVRKALVLFKTPRRAQVFMVTTVDEATHAKQFSELPGLTGVNFEQIRTQVAKGFMPATAATAASAAN